MINILYIHGYGSSSMSRTAMNLEKHLSPDYKVYHPTIPFNPIEALSFINTFINDNTIDIVVGSSLGGFLVLSLRNITRIVLNPCCHPSIELPKLGVTEDLSSYSELECDLWKNISPYEHKNTYGIFSTHDELFTYKNEFCNYYNSFYEITDTHHISDDSINKVLIPLIYLITSNHNDGALDM